MKFSKFLWGMLFVFGLLFTFNVEALASTDLTEQPQESTLNQVNSDTTEPLYFYSSDSSIASSFAHRVGDILVTKATQCGGGVKCLGITGHSGIILSNGLVLHIQGPGYTPKQITIDAWYSKYTSTKIVRDDNVTTASNAANWAYNHFVNGAGKSVPYDVATTLTSLDKTYCSKLVWSAYYHGANKSIVGQGPGFIAPYDFVNYTSFNGQKVVRTVNW